MERYILNSIVVKKDDLDEYNNTTCSCIDYNLDDSVTNDDENIKMRLSLYSKDQVDRFLGWILNNNKFNILNYTVVYTECGCSYLGCIHVYSSDSNNKDHMLEKVIKNGYEL